VVDYTARADAGDVEAARQIHAKLEPARMAFDRWMREPWLERRIVPIAQLKAWLALVGLPQGPVRPPLKPLSAEEEARLRQDLERLELLRG
jgi:dihydrodipicolinate synthase/N-acetylneuraminate lyase